jgi:hypothetical protein
MNSNLVPVVDDDVDDLNIAALFQGGRYVVPRYQRNYAWGEAQVLQLLQDVMDTAIAQDGREYYLGSLVTYRRPDGEYETIDGQQRHTTLAILLAVLANGFGQDLGGIVAPNLRFDTRPRSDVTLQHMFDGEIARFDETSMGQTYDVAMRFLQERSLDEVRAFTKTLLSSVKVLRVVVPQDTDLNHYFEIMNNRGEQLEKHEVLKARLMSQLPPGRAQRTFAIIWDACADMRRHVQMGFSAALRLPLFGESLDRAPRDFKVVCSLVTDADNVQESETLADILNSPQNAAAPAPGAEQEGTSDEARAAIVDFPNFLLYALHAFTGKRVTLDDKRLLDAFDEHRPDPGDFVHVLLKYRLLFDRFVVRRWDGKWNLKTLRYSRELNQYSYLNSIGDTRVLTQLTMLLSMFHVSFPSQSYKHWLDATLVYLYQHADSDPDFGAAFAGWLERLGRRFLRLNGGAAVGDAVLQAPLTADAPEFFDATSLPRGTAVPNFVFNWLDYLLWKRLRDATPLDGVNMKYVRERLERFEFTFRTSVEHYYPRHPMSDDRWDDCDRFGNLCLISHSRNSELSNYSPGMKKEHYEKARTTESLKQTIMMSYKDWGPSHIGNIDAHEQMMFALLEA